VTGFVDLHTHVIPSGDDGAPSVEAGVELCRAMAAQGTRVVYGTPHAHPPDSWFPITDERIALVRRSYAEMKPRCAEFGLDLRLGWELSATGALVGDLDDYVLEGTRAVLLELPGPWFSFDDEVAVTREQASLIRAAGLQVVLAHPERSLGVQTRPELLSELAEEGALVCFNADSFVGGHGERCEECAWRLLELGLGDFVASDAHRPERPSRLHEAVRAIAARYGEERALSLARGEALTGAGTTGARA
jgi:protein-tyrosine phosphatase